MNWKRKPTRAHLGTWVTINHMPTIQKIIRLHDFVIIDMEHGHFNIKDILNILCINYLKTFVRIPSYNAEIIAQLLDGGCTNILVSHVESANEAYNVVYSSKFNTKDFDTGIRGLSPYTPGNDFGLKGINEKILQSLNNDINIGILVEGYGTKKEMFPLICNTPVDIIYIGVYDLAMYMGHKGNLEHPDVKAKINECIKIIHDNDKIAATFAKDVNSARALDWIGCDMIALENDSHVMLQKYVELIEDYNKSVKT